MQNLLLIHAYYYTLPLGTTQNITTAQLAHVVQGPVALQGYLPGRSQVDPQTRSHLPHGPEEVDDLVPVQGEHVTMVHF